MTKKIRTRATRSHWFSCFFVCLLGIGKHHAHDNIITDVLYLSHTHYTDCYTRCTTNYQYDYGFMQGEKKISDFIFRGEQQDTRFQTNAFFVEKGRFFAFAYHTKKSQYSHVCLEMRISRFERI